MNHTSAVIDRIANDYYLSHLWSDRATQVREDYEGDEAGANEALAHELRADAMSNGRWIGISMMDVDWEWVAAGIS